MRIFCLLIGLSVSASYAIADETWQMFRDPDGHFSMDVPHAIHVEYTTERIPRSMTVAETSDLTVRMANYSYGKDNTHCTISELDFGKAFVPKNMAELQAKQFKDLNTVLGFKFFADGPVTLDAIIGWDQSLKDTDGFVLNVRRFLIKNKLIGIECRVAPDATLEQIAENKRVLNSFHLAP